MAKAIQSLEQFTSTFGADPVEIELSQFATDGSFSDVSVFLKPLTSSARDRFEASVVGVDGKRDLTNLRARLVAECLCDESGENIGNADAIGALRADVVGILFDAVRSLNHMDTDDEAGKD